MYSTHIRRDTPSAQTRSKGVGKNPGATSRWLPIVLPLHARIGRKLKQSARAQRKTSVFFDFYDVNMNTKSKTYSEFSRVSFGDFF